MGERHACYPAFLLPWMFQSDVPRGTVYSGLGFLWGNPLDFVHAQESTAQVMDGETGESACLPGEDLYEAWKAALGTAETHYHFYDAVNGRGSFCPAPTPRAP